MPRNDDFGAEASKTLETLLAEVAHQIKTHPVDAYPHRGTTLKCFERKIEDTLATARRLSGRQD